MSVRGLKHADTPCSELWQSAAQIAWRHHEPCPSRPSVRRSLKAFYLVTEQYDAVAISEVPNDETVAKLSLRTAALDNVRTETLRAFNEDGYRKNRRFDRPNQEAAPTRASLAVRPDVDVVATTTPYVSATPKSSPQPITSVSTPSTTSAKR